MSTPKSGSKAAKVQARKSLAVAMWNMAIAYPEVAKEFRNLALSEAEEVAEANTSRAGNANAKPNKKVKDLLAEVVSVDGDAIEFAIPKGWPIVQTESGRTWVEMPLNGVKRSIAVKDCNSKLTKSKATINRKVYRKENWSRQEFSVGELFGPDARVVGKANNQATSSAGKGSTSKKSKKTKKSKKSAKQTASKSISKADSNAIARHQLTMSTGRGPQLGGCTCGADYNCKAVKDGLAEKVWEISLS